MELAHRHERRDGEEAGLLLRHGPTRDTRAGRLAVARTFARLQRKPRGVVRASRCGEFLIEHLAHAPSSPRIDEKFDFRLRPRASVAVFCAERDERIERDEQIALGDAAAHLDRQTRRRAEAARAPHGEGRRSAPRIGRRDEADIARRHVIVARRGTGERDVHLARKIRRIADLHDPFVQSAHERFRRQHLARERPRVRARDHVAHGIAARAFRRETDLRQRRA